jgi:hypothetical protein
MLQQTLELLQKQLENQGSVTPYWLRWINSQRQLIQLQSASKKCLLSCSACLKAAEINTSQFREDALIFSQKSEQGIGLLKKD